MTQLYFTPPPKKQNTVRLTNVYTPAGAGGGSRRVLSTFLYTHWKTSQKRVKLQSENLTEMSDSGSLASHLPIIFILFYKPTALAFKNFRLAPLLLSPNLLAFWIVFFLGGRMRVKRKCLLMKDPCFQVLLAMGVPREHQHGTSED